MGFLELRYGRLSHMCSTEYAATELQNPSWDSSSGQSCLSAFITAALATRLNECGDATCVARGFPQWNLSSSVYESTVGRSQSKVDFWVQA
ncbi:hypothetical protein Nepgr_003249 [Nepenthes gracilis]|uniref:Uncharacterized protein n=1 Tax=Nepenthes gracilis TaxID=150966 RepID=A0AAD3XDJ0_NEPGR|nr:hypothetical protein Nepgr_003249 [Nepenthes gracilis]